MQFSDKDQIKNKGKIRILYFTPFYQFPNTKVETYMTSEVKAILNNYPNIEYLVYFVSYRIRNKIVRNDDRILQINRKSYKNLLFLKDMIRIFAKFKPNVIHSHYVVPSIIINFFAKLFRIPTILHGRGTDINYQPYYSVKSKILLLLAGALNNVILTVSKSMKTDCLRFKIKDKKIKVIYNGINFTYFNPKNKIFFSNQRPLELLHVGSLNPRKAQQLIIEACKKLREKNIEFHLTLIGEGILRKVLVDLITKYKLEQYVDLLGALYHKKVQSYMEKADILVFPSKSEGLPNAVLEAMSMKLIVILTRVDGHIEIAQKRGSILVDTNNPQQLFEAIFHYYNNPKEIEIGGEINRNFIVNTFSWQKHAKELYHVYYSLAKKKRKLYEN